jgi:uncharacterized protein YjbJ (UPF0337 family)
MSNKTQDVKGKVKEAAGNVTGNEQLEAHGKADQAKAAVKDVGEKAKDAAGEIKDKLAG